MEQKDVEPNGVTFTTAIGACERSQRWEMALDFLRRLERSNGDQLGAMTCNAVMAACAAGSAWAEAVHIFWDALMQWKAHEHHEAWSRDIFKKRVQEICPRCMF